MSTSVQEKLDKLSNKMEDGRPDAIAEVESMRKTFKNAAIKKELAKNIAMSKLLSMLRKREESYSTLLSNKEDMTEIQRAGYFNRRKEVRFILSFFDSADTTIESLEKVLDYQLSDEITVNEDVDKS